MQYFKTTFFTINASVREILIARLANEGFEGFEETDERLDAYIPLSAYNAETISLVAGEYNTPYETEVIGQQNWNHEWEKNFNPVVVDDFCTIRADFHDIDVRTIHEIVITPKMTFGTGHHATTQLMVKMMRDLDFAGSKVFDFGTGTGILAILAEKLGAEYVEAIDNDTWSYENSIENLQRNHCKHVHIKAGSIENVEDTDFNIILANINRHILLQYMSDMYSLLKAGGTILMSGLLKEDRVLITDAATNAGFKEDKYEELNNWIALSFGK
ncbi:MAG: 50S ribosomal protein L11 methyltransferase [Flavipsychrobacter sp.]